MIVQTKVTFKEYIKLLFRLAYKRLVMRLLVAVAALLMLWVIFYYLDIFNLPKPIIYQYITLILIVVVQPAIIFATVWRNYHSSNHLRETLQMEILPDELSVEGESFYLKVQWEKLFKIVENPKYFLMYQNNLSAIMIPKKDMTKDEINRVKLILKDLKIIPVQLENK